MIVEGMIDMAYVFASEYLSWRTGLPTVVEKHVIAGPRVDGVIRPDLRDRYGLEFRYTYTRGRNAQVEHGAREIRRRIVIDQTKL